MRSLWPEGLLAALVAVLVVSLCNPLWMPMGVYYVAAVALLLAVGMFSVFVWRERGGDERDALLRRVGAQAAMIACASVLVAGTAYQAISRHAVDYWLAAALAALVVGKVVGYSYADRRH